MRASYRYNGKWYIFVWFQDEPTNKISLIANANTDNEKTILIPCRHKENMAIQINKKSVSATGGAYGVMRFIQDAIRNDLGTGFINLIIRQFALGEAIA